MVEQEKSGVGGAAGATAAEPSHGSAAAMRRYEVAGVDELGDVHVFRTDDRERADGVRRQLEEDLEHVLLCDLGDGAAVS